MRAVLLQVASDWHLANYVVIDVKMNVWREGIHQFRIDKTLVFALLFETSCLARQSTEVI